MQIKRWVWLGVVIMLAGCSTARFGNFSQAPNETENLMAKDAVNELAVIYPPAKTQFNVPIRLKDEFGCRLVLGLRERGFALFDAGEIAPDKLPQIGYTLAWVLDDVGESTKVKSYRLSLYVGLVELSRLYQQEGTSIKPAGNWTRKTMVSVDKESGDHD